MSAGCGSDACGFGIEQCAGSSEVGHWTRVAVRSG